MHLRRAWVLTVPFAGLLGAGIAAAPASADLTQQFNCSAAVAQVSALGANLPIGSFVSNAGNTVCSDSQSLVPSTGGTVVVPGLGTVTLGSGSGSATSQILDPANMAVNSVATLSGVTIPTPAGNITIPGSAEATADLACVDGKVQGSVGSTLSSLMVGGQQFNLPSPGATQVIPLTLPLTGTQIGTLTVNGGAVTATGATKSLLDVSIPSVGDVVLGQANATSPSGDQCSSIIPAGPSGPSGPTGPTGPGGTPTPVDPGPVGPGGTNGSNGSNGGSGRNGTNGRNGGCPAGTVLLSTGSCALTGGPGQNSTIIVDRAGSGNIVGGKVISLAQARKLYRGASCLNGAGPKFVVVGTKGNDRIKVSRLRMRVLGLAGNDRITVVGGNRTCVNGGAGRDTIGNAKPNRVTIFGANGNDRLTVGNGVAFVLGGNGNDVIKAGLGRDRLDGGAGSNRITALGRVAFVSASRGSNTVARVRAANGKFARTHGVRKVSPITG